MKELKGWSEFEKRLIYDRYSVREPGTRKRLEKTYEDVIDRITHYILSKDFPVSQEILKEALNWARNRKLTFATPALMNLGNPYVSRKGYYSCFALGPIPDNTKEIFEYQNTCATIFQYAGGSGMDFSQLRAKDSPVDGDQGVSSGPCSFIELFEKVSNVIAAGGKRRGAELGQLDCIHPNIFDFIKLKQTNSNLPAINISVNVLNEFWENEKLISEIAKGMWLTGDPGLLFPDEMSSNSPYPPKWKSLARYVNPCGEYAAPPFSVCNLLTGSAISNSDGLSEVDYFEQLGYYMAYLGNCILWITLKNEGEGLPKESVHFQKIFNTVSEIRPIGVGLTGVAEYLYSNDISYHNTKKIKDIYFALTRGSLIASSEWCEATNQEAEWDEEYKKQHLDKISYAGNTKFWNTTTTCQAPTGSVSQFLRCLSTGIEPLSSGTITRSFYGSDNLFHDVKLSSLVVEEDAKLNPVSIDDQLDVVSTIQNLMHTSASKTIIVPEETTVEDIKGIIYKAKDLKVKGLTVYRMGCSLDAIVKDHVEEESVATTKTKLPDIREGLTFKFRGMNSLYVTINLLNNKPIEVFMASGKSGNVVNGLCMGLGRLASLALRSGTSVEDVVKSLEDISTGDFYINQSTGKADSISDALSKALHYFTTKNQIEETKTKTKEKTSSFDLCPQCGNYTLKKTGSCKSCIRCNYSTC